MPYTCDLHSVGVLAVDAADPVRYLLIERSDGKGHAPVAGHVFDNHSGPREAARAEMAEEAGLAVVSLTLAAEGWMPNRCSGHIPEGCRPGHYWWIFEARVTGELDPCPEETRGAQWATATHLQHLAHQTVSYAHGNYPAPGLEPVWCHWLDHLGVISLSFKQREHVAALAATVPTTTSEGR